MTRHRTPSAQTIRVLQALASDPSRWRYGYDLSEEVELKSGSLYPILMRLAERELLETSWESGPAGRPPRHLYRLTARGLAESPLPTSGARGPSRALRTELGEA